MGLNPYTVENLLGGSARILYAPVDEDVPSGLEDVFDQVGPDYDPNGEFADFGATTDGSQYERKFDSQDYDIEQTSSAVFSEITSTDRSLTVPVAEFTQASLALLEEGTESSHASGSGHSDQDVVEFGSIEDLTPYRVVMVGRRAKASGAVVTETASGLVRGAFVAVVFKRMTLAADSSQIELAKGKLSSIPVTFTAVPEPGEEARLSHGKWLVEQPGTISGS